MIGDEQDDSLARNRQAVLEACEETIRRLTVDGRYFARPARTLFNDVRMYFSMQDQQRVWCVIERNLAIAQQFLEEMPELLDLEGQPRECRAHTRKGTPCQREPLPGRDYCPSHKHLEETFEAAEIELSQFERDLDRDLVPA
ncbi:MAG TPA: hypothetical protein VIL04_10410 [Solirubrobacterales bacterium]